MDKYNENAIAILKEMFNVKLPIGAIYLSDKLSIPQASVGRLLNQLDNENLVEKVGRKGRILTSKGKDYLKKYEQQNSRIATVNHLANLCSDGVDKDKLLEVLEVRILLEKKTVELACTNEDRAVREQLKQCILEWKLTLQKGELGSEQDLRLHLLIAKMSKNTTLYSMCKLLLTEDNVYAGFSAKAEKLNTIQTEQHEAIVKAILLGDAEAAKAAMDRHLSTIKDDIKKSRKI